MTSRFAYFVAAFALSAFATFSASHAFSDSLADSAGSVAEVAQSSVAKEQGNSRKYLVLGLSYDVTGTSRFMDEDCLSTSPAALYGCGAGSDGRPRATYGDFGTPAGLEIGVGMRSSTNWRREFTVQYRPDISFSGNSNFDGLSPERQFVSASLSTLSFMFSGYYDLVGSGNSNGGEFTPYIGAGLGVSRIDIGQTTMTFPITSTDVPGGHHTGLSWLFALGVSRKIEGLGTLDLGWRYMDFGRVVTPRGPGSVVRNDDGSLVIDLDLAPTQAKLTSVGLRIALRQDF